MADDKLAALTERVLVLETTQGQISPAAFRNIMSVVALFCSLGGGIISLYAASILAPVESRVTVLENISRSLEGVDKELSAASAILAAKVDENHGTMIERTEALQSGISDTLSTAAIEARFSAISGSVAALQDSIFRIVRERLQPQIDRNRDDAEDVENKFESHLSNHPDVPESRQ